MSVRKFFAIASLVLVASAAAPSKASADWLFTPFVGWNWGGTANLVNGRRLRRRVRAESDVRRVARLDGRGRHRLRSGPRLLAELLRADGGLRQLRVRRQQPDHVHGQPDRRHSDWRPERRRLPALRGRRRRASSRAASTARKISSRSTRRTGASTSARARCSSSPTSSGCAATSATSGRCKTIDVDDRRTSSMSGWPTSSFWRGTVG